jgi:hypothetical protein
MVSSEEGRGYKVANGWRNALQRAGAVWYAGLVLSVLGLTAVAHAVSPLMFRRFIGEANTMAVVMSVSALGGGLLSVLVIRDGFWIARQAVGRGVLRSVGYAALFGAVIIVADLAMLHPADINVPFPYSVLFCPVIGFMAEVVFHLLPLCLLLTVVSARGMRDRSEATVWGCLILVALLEPAFQVWTAASGMPVVGAPLTYASRATRLATADLHATMSACSLPGMLRHFNPEPAAENVAGNRNAGAGAAGSNPIAPTTFPVC